MKAPVLFPNDPDLESRLDRLQSTDREYAWAMAGLLRAAEECHHAHRAAAMQTNDAPLSARKAAEFEARAARDEMRRALDVAQREMARHWAET